MAEMHVSACVSFALLALCAASGAAATPSICDKYAGALGID